MAGNFAGIEQAVVDNKKYLAEGQPTVAGTYLLDASQIKERCSGPISIAVSTTRRNGWDFPFPNLPAGRYAVVIQKISGDKDPITLTMILQDMGGAGSWPAIIPGRTQSAATMATGI